MRMDAAIARLSVLVCTAAQIKHENGRPMEMKDFMPYGHEPEQEATLEDLASILTGKKKG